METAWKFRLMQRCGNETLMNPSGIDGTLLISGDLCRI